MSFVINGLAPQSFAHLFGLPDGVLSRQNIVRRTVEAKPGYPCRITLQDAEPGETVLLLNYESHSAATPYAIYVREGATATATYRNALPPVFMGRPIALRLFSAEGMLLGADMGRGEELTAKIEAAFAQANVAYIHAHNAMHGCFSAEIRRAD